ncbi:MAG: hypothetical protein C0458_05595 [Methylobacterium sp.]|nr:hypothetical protein [Methylobacterium sp.]
MKWRHERMFAHGERDRKSKVRKWRDAESRPANYYLAMDFDDEFFLGAKLKIWRKSRGLTLEQMAADIGTSKGYLSDMERDKRPLTSRWLAKVAGVYGTKVSEIIGAPPPSADPGDDEERMAKQILRLKGLGKIDKVRWYLDLLEAEAQSAPSPSDEDATAARQSAKSGR